MAEDWRSIPIDEIAWPARFPAPIQWETEGVRTLGDMAELSDHAIRRVPGVGAKNIGIVLLILMRALSGEDVRAVQHKTTVGDLARNLMASRPNCGGRLIIGNDGSYRWMNTDPKEKP